MSSKPEDKREAARAAAYAREAAREITHSRTERARVLDGGEGERRRHDDGQDAGAAQQAAQQGARFVAGVKGDTVGPELAEYVDSGAAMAEETEVPAAGTASKHPSTGCVSPGGPTGSL